MRKTILITIITAVFAVAAVAHADPQINPVPEASTIYAGAALLVPLGIGAVASYRRRSRKK